MNLEILNDHIEQKNSFFVDDAELLGDKFYKEKHKL
jgi:hypothetical protein